MWHGHEIERASFIDILFTLLQNRNVATYIVETKKGKKNNTEFNFKLYVTVEKHYRANKFTIFVRFFYPRLVHHSVLHFPPATSNTII